MQGAMKPICELLTQNPKGGLAPKHLRERQHDHIPIRSKLLGLEYSNILKQSIFGGGLNLQCITDDKAAETSSTVPD